MQRTERMTPTKPLTWKKQDVETNGVSASRISSILPQKFRMLEEVQGDPRLPRAIRESVSYTVNFDERCTSSDTISRQWAGSLKTIMVKYF